MTRLAWIAIAVVEAVLIVVLALALRPEHPAMGGADRMTDPVVPPDSPPLAAPREPAPPPVAETESTAPAVTPSRDAPAIQGVLLFGALTSRTGNRLKQAGVGLRHFGSSDTVFPFRAPVGDYSNEYAIPGLSPGRYELIASASGHRPTIIEMEIPPDVDRVRRDIVLAANWDLRVSLVTPDGVPLRDAVQASEGLQASLGLAHVSVIATLTPPPNPIPAVSGHEPDLGLGQWIDSFERQNRGLPGLPKRYAGTHSLPVDVPLHISAVLRSAVLASERVEPGQEELRLVVGVDDVARSRCRVRLRVIDGASGAVVTEARVALNTTQSVGAGDAVDGDGRIELTAGPGVHRLDVLAASTRSSAWNLDLAPGAVVDLGDVPLHEYRWIALRIEGVPEGARVSYLAKSLEAPPHPALRARWSYFVPGPDGAMAVQVAPGRASVRVTAGTAIAVVDFDTRRLGDAPLAVTLAPGAVLHVLPPPLERGVTLLITEESGTAVARFGMPSATPYDLTLPIGRYDAAITRPDGSVEHRTLVLGTGKNELDLR
ncbi:MAG: hypothetical protein HZB39_17530 [Planctomycetes bacterium]|nr:hypothetical protein [Planctomycetota bacterium]